MSDLKYRKGESPVDTPNREVDYYTAEESDTHTAGVLFRCPCNFRMIHCKIPPHKVTFDKEGIMTIDNSIGSKGKIDAWGEPRPANWCHFFIKDGVPSMASDAKCHVID